MLYIDFMADKKTELTLDQEKCIGCGMCVGISDELFEIDYEKNKASIRQGADLNKKGNLAKAKEAIKMCPTVAIVLK